MGFSYVKYSYIAPYFIDDGDKNVELYSGAVLFDGVLSHVRNSSCVEEESEPCFDKRSVTTIIKNYLDAWFDSYPDTHIPASKIAKIMAFLRCPDGSVSEIEEDAKEIADAIKGDVSLIYSRKRGRSYRAVKD